MRHLLKFLICLWFAIPAVAEPYFMDLARDLEKVGDIATHSDDMDMRMTWVFNHPAWLVEEGLREFLEDGEYGLEKKERGKNEVYMESRWLVQDARVVPFSLLGVNQIRTKIVGRVKPLGENKTQVLFTVALQVQETQRIESGWVDRSERQAREYLWMAACSTGVSSRYPGNQAIFTRLIEDYKNQDRRHGLEGYELPPRQVAVKPEAQAAPESGPARAAAPSSLADELKKLKDLLDSGAINPKEYQTAKDKLLKN